MNILNSVLGALGGGQGDSGQLMATVMSLLNGDPNQPGNNIGELLNQFQGSGLGDIVQSWIGTGDNMPISGSQIRDALGDGQLSSLAQQTGISADQLPDQLADLLPQAVDKLTPGGEIPSGSLDMDSLGKMLGSFLGR